MIDKCVDVLNQGNSIIIFPEGTRTPIGSKLGKFRKGAARIAIKSGCDIRPIYLTCQPRFLSKSQKWYEIPPKRVNLTLDVGDEFKSNVIGTGHSYHTSSRLLTRYLEKHFSSNLDKLIKEKEKV